MEDVVSVEAGAATDRAKRQLQRGNEKGDFGVRRER